MQHPRIQGLVFAALTLIGTTLAWLRVPASTRDGVYAEDGMFLRTWALDNNPLNLLDPYAGYQHLLPRISSGLVVNLAPISQWGLGVTFVSCLMVGLVGGLSYLAARRVLTSPVNQIAVGLLPALIPLAGVEAIGNLANVHWFLFYLLFWILLAQPTSRWGRIGWGTLALVAALTEAQTVVLAPLALWQFWKSPKSRGPVIGWALGTAGQVLTYLFFPRDAPAEVIASVADLTNGYVANTILSNQGSGQFHAAYFVSQHGWWLAWLLAVLVLAAAISHALRTDGEQRFLALWALLVSYLSWVLAITFNDIPDFADVTEPDFLVVRWGTTAAMLLVASVVVSLDGFTGWRQVFAQLVVVVLFVGLSINAVQDNILRIGVTWSPQLKQARIECADQPDASTTIEILPQGWSTTMPCRAILDQ